MSETRAHSPAVADTEPGQAAPEPVLRPRPGPGPGPIVDRRRDGGRFRHALELSRLSDGMIVVDWGCAHGWLATLIAARCPGSRVIACDIPYAHGAPEFSAPNVEYHLLDQRAPRLPVGDMTVDRIFALDVLEHMGTVSRLVALAEMRRILKPDGMLIVTVPHRGLLHWTDVENVRMRFPRAHREVFELVRGKEAYRERYGTSRLVNFSSDATDHHHYTETELVEVLRASGFTARDRRFFGMLYPAAWTLSIALEAVRRLTGHRHPRLARLVANANRLAVDVRAPRQLADSLAVAAAPLPAGGRP